MWLLWIEMKLSFMATVGYGCPSLQGQLIIVQSIFAAASHGITWKGV